MADVAADRIEDIPERKLKDQKAKKEKKPQEPKAKQAPKKKIEGAALIGIDVAKEDDLADWYQQVLTKGKMIDFYDVSGCYILLPSSYSIWEQIRKWFDARIATIGVKNCYFPVFISKANLEREKEHLEGFAAEVAWVTQGGTSKLAEPVAVRPTSETAMYGYYAKTIQSHRDLPLKLNQWNNVVRWEFKHPMPFLRSREFLWQEGHTAHLTPEGAGEEVLQILDWYAGIFEELLAVPVVKGQKTENEKFPGADYTTTIEGYISSTGRGIQAGTSHCLGQHFSKMYNITVEDPSAKEADSKARIHVYQNSWGLTTRSIGVMILTHGDNKGLVIPPRVADTQVVIVPVGITAKTKEEDKEKMMQQIQKVYEDLQSATYLDVPVRVELDTREGYSPGWKFNDWELKGVPLRLEIGPKDLEKDVATYSCRHAEGKDTVSLSSIAQGVPDILGRIQSELFKRADEAFASHRKVITAWDDFVPALNDKNVCLIKHCLGGPCEDEIKDLSKRVATEGLPVDEKAPSMGAKSLCIPFDQKQYPEIKEGDACTNPNCKSKAQKWVMFGRSY